MVRLTTSILVASALRQAQAKGIFAAVLRQGDEQAGTILIEVEIDPAQSLLYGGKLVLTAIMNGSA